LTPTGHRNRRATLIADNPIVALRRRYNVKHSKPIWRALASSNPDEELAACDSLHPSAACWATSCAIMSR
jgi:hypothetical protein